MNKLISIIVLAGMCSHLNGQEAVSDQPSQGVPEYSPFELLEVWGWLVGEQFQLNVLDLNDAEVDAIADGIRKYVKTEIPEVDLQFALPQLQRYTELRQKRVLEEQLENGRAEENAFFDGMVGEPNIQSLGTGLHFKIIEKGGEVKPTDTNLVKVNYRGTLLNGKEFDSSYSRGEPTVFGLNQVIPGWSQGIQLIGEGGKIELYVPSKLAYGDAGSPGIPAGSALIFEVELLEILPPEEANPAPAQQNPPGN
ncbi:FKBP-type peptidyl-prolyl cis-trans isomerase [Puniceicoccaceae bacterium K14]|nr:FKBP-type peptidyl-prolyl cis-trans isomerase [Puniceicoccaceae bacterium K14]